MRDALLIIGFNRPEFLTVCLELIAKNPGYKKLTHIFALGHGHDPKNLDVIKKHPCPHKEIIHTRKFPHKFTRQSYNVLNGLREAALRSKKYVFLVEDDIFIANDFFKWHYAVHNAGRNIFCSIGTENHNTFRDTVDDPSAYYFGSQTDYQGWGVCYNKDVIQKHICPHMINDYWEKPRAYCQKLGPWLGGKFCEQDGLIRRIMKKSGLTAAFPHVPRGFHAGFYGKNRGISQPPGFAGRLKHVRNVCFDKDMMKWMSGKYWRDSVPQNLMIDKWETVQYIEAKPCEL